MSKRAQMPRRVRAYGHQTPAQRWYHHWIAQQHCAVCGVADPVVLNNHHLNPSTKKYEIGRILSGGFSLEVLQHELDKTIPVCLNCHARIHKFYKWGKIGSLIPAEWSKKEWALMTGEPNGR